MKRNFLIAMILLVAGVKNIYAQDFARQIAEHREKYKNDFLTEKDGPLKPADVQYIEFYPADENYAVKATFTLTPDEKEFDIATYSGKQKKYIKYGILTFTINGQQHHLSVYQGIELRKHPEYSDYLFIPFKDFTNGVETYGGGRYMDYRTSDIRNNVLLLDFNKAYNPYCAYSEGYSCPIPPDENHLQTEIKAGEKKFGKDH